MDYQISIITLINYKHNNNSKIATLFTILLLTIVQETFLYLFSCKLHYTFGLESEQFLFCAVYNIKNFYELINMVTSKQIYDSNLFHHCLHCIYVNHLNNIMYFPKSVG